MVEQADLLFELGTEELPPTALNRLSQALTAEFIAGLERANLKHGEIESFATPRRLGLLIHGCATQQPERSTERRGPAVAAAFAADGNPTKAAEGFASSCGTTVDQLGRIETDKGEWLTFLLHEPGQPAAELLPKIAAQALNRLPIPKRMRWGSSEAQFVRPVHWLLFIHGDKLVPCTILDAKAGNLTYGHRFHHPQAITIDNPAEYAAKLENEGYVIADFARRRERIREQVEQTAASLDGRADLDAALLDEVTALNEWPLPIAASFEERFLEVPQEALVLTMKKNQKYFPLFDSNDRLINHFITIANIDSPQPEVIRAGNERVVRPRLADAMFFWQQDAKQRLEEHIESLKQVVFQQKLGSMFDKSERVAALAASIASQIGGDQALTQRAGMLSRCDLMTAMVGEFPEMQGIMGRYQAGRDGETAELATALEEFYLPRFSGDALPTTLTGIAISLADRMDSLIGIFAIGQKPTGDKDPFALRRAALGALRIMREHALEIPLNELIVTAASAIRVEGKALSDPQQVENEVRDFLLERLKGLCLDQAVTVASFNAVVGVGFSSIADFDRRLQAVIQFADLPEAEALAAANKRISNIIRKADCTIPAEVDGSLFKQDEEGALERQIRDMASRVQPLLQQADYTGTLLALAGLRAEVDRFFDAVMVMDDNPKVRGNRLALLNALRNLFLEVADVSQLQA